MSKLLLRQRPPGYSVMLLLMAALWLPWLCVMAQTLADDHAALLKSGRYGAAAEDAARTALTQKLHDNYIAHRRNAEAQALLRGLPLRKTSADGVHTMELMGWEGTRPLYYTTLNLNSAISSGANILWSAPYQALGGSNTVGVWDAGSVRNTHQEFGGRVTIVDNVANHSHATHVAGTIAASGVVSAAHGMAPQAFIDSYDWNNDFAEMAAAGAAVSGDAGKIYLSNHSYGYSCGWVFDSGIWYWYGEGDSQTNSEPYFGMYNSVPRDADTIAYNAPYYAMFWAAGNDRNNNPANGNTIKFDPNGPSYSYDKTVHPPGDGVYRGGYDTISFVGVSKNVITVGAVNDAVTSGSRDVTKATMSDFSSWGPADDGRIKPDIVANGVGLYSTTTGGDTLYATMSGTSMASPSAAGAAQQLIGYYAALSGGQYMRAATVKGVLIHTADDLGTAGPDYKFGWGLINAKAAADLIGRTLTNNLPGIIEDALTSGDTIHNHRFFWDKPSPIRVTMCWTDPAATAIWEHDDRTARLINNLNVKVVAPDGRQFFPYVMPFVGNWSTNSMTYAATTGTNNTDNVEQVYIAAPATPGYYTAVVTFSGSLLNNLQPYSLLISGAKAPPPAPTIMLIF